MHYPEQPTANEATANANANNNFPMMMTMMMTCSLPLPPTCAPNTIPKPEMHYVNLCPDLTTHWLHATFEPVFQAIDCLTIAIANLSNRILKASLKNTSPLDPKP